MMKKLLVAVVITLSLAAAGLAQRGGRGGPGGQRPDPAAALRTALDLTEGQVSGIQALMQTGKERSQAIRGEIEQKRKALNTLLSAASPNPQEVGAAAISLRSSENRMSAERDWLITEIKKLLTGDQQQKLDTILAANGRGLPGLGGFGPRGGGPRPGK